MDLSNPACPSVCVCYLRGIRKMNIRPGIGTLILLLVIVACLVLYLIGKLNPLVAGLITGVAIGCLLRGDTNA